MTSPVGGIIRPAMGYRGRIAPTPSWYLHLGHARTFLAAEKRAREAGGVLILRIEDIDGHRCRQEYLDAAVEDLRWLGIEWQEGPDVGGDFAPYYQSARMGYYLDAWARLRDAGAIYPSRVSRRELEDGEPDENEPLFPTALRPDPAVGRSFEAPGDWNWRFRAKYGRKIAFRDGRCGGRVYEAGVHFGDFVVWRRDGPPAYELAVVVDDMMMGVTEIVRGSDLLKSTARQLLLYEAFGALPPAFYHSPLVLDSEGRRLAKRDQSMSLREIRARGISPDHIRAKFGFD